MSAKIKTIAVASIWNPRNAASWSGTPAHMSFAFEDSGIEVVKGGPLEASEPSYYRWLRSGYWRLGRGWFLGEVEPRILNQRAAALHAILRDSAPDAVVSVLADPIAAAPTGVVTALVHDATFELLVGYYPEFTGLSKRSIRLGHQAYKQALEHASLYIYSSEWAARSAIRDYGADPARVHVVEFGANLRNPPTRQEVDGFVEARLTHGQHRFLFLGVNWLRKGGDDAVAMVRTLRRMGVSAFLDVVGCPLEGSSTDREFCVEHGFLDKSQSRDRARLEHLLENASFLLVPSQAECCACAFCEASAYGLPSIGRDTGGVSQVIKSGLNGFLLSEDSRNLDEIAEQVRSCLLNPDEYRKMAIGFRDEFEQRLNWGRFVGETLRLLEAAKG